VQVTVTCPRESTFEDKAPVVPKLIFCAETRQLLKVVALAVKLVLSKFDNELLQAGHVVKTQA